MNSKGASTQPRLVISHVYAQSWAARKIQEVAASEGFSVVSRLESNRRRSSILSWPKEIKGADIVMVLLSPQYFSVAFSNSEWNSLALLHKRLVPIIIEDCDTEPFVGLNMPLDLSATPRAEWAGLISRVLRGEPPGDSSEDSALDWDVLNHEGASQVTAVSNVPSLGSMDLLAQRELLTEIDRTFGDDNSGAEVQAIVGRISSGKSSLASLYGRLREREFDIVWWCRADNEIALRADLEMLRLELGVEASGDVVRDIATWADAGAKSWLLILDDAVDVRQSLQMIPRSRNGRILITTRALDLPWRIKQTEVERLEHGLALEFLLSRLGRADLRACRQLSQELDGHPYLLSLASSWVRSAATRSVHAYRRQLRKVRAENPLTSVSQAAVDLALKGVREASEQALRLLRVVCVVGPNGISIERLSDYLSFDDETLTEALLSNTALGTLMLSDGGQVSAHPLVAEQVVDAISSDDLRAIIHSVADKQADVVAAASSPHIGMLPEWSLIDNAAHFLDLCHRVTYRSSSVSRLAHVSGQHLMLRGHHLRASEFFAQGLRSSGAEDSSLRYALACDMASALAKLGRYSRATDLLETSFRDADADVLSRLWVANTATTLSHQRGDIVESKRWLDIAQTLRKSLPREALGQTATKSALLSLDQNRAVIGMTLSRDAGGGVESLESVLVTARRAFGAANPLTIRARIALEVAKSTASPEESISTRLERAMDLIARSHGTESREWLDCLDAVSFSAASHGDVHKAFVCAVEAFRLRSRDGGLFDSQALDASALLARLLLRQGDFEQSYRVLAKVSDYARLVWSESKIAYLETLREEVRAQAFEIGAGRVDEL